MRKLIPQILQTDSSIEVVGTAMDGNSASGKSNEPEAASCNAGSRNARHGADRHRNAIRRRHHLPVTFWLVPIALRELRSRCKPCHSAHSILLPNRLTGLCMPEIAAELIGKYKGCRAKPWSADANFGPRLAGGSKANSTPSGLPPRSSPSVYQPGGRRRYSTYFRNYPRFSGHHCRCAAHAEGFTEMFARRLDETCAIRIKEAQSGDVLVAESRVLILSGQSAHQGQEAATGECRHIER